MNKRVSLLVYIKKKYAYTNIEEKMMVLADALKGKYVGGGTNISNMERDQQYYFESKEDANTFLEYPTVKEAIKGNYDLVEI